MNPLSPAQSPFSSVDIIVVPDDDDEALALFPKDIVEETDACSVTLRGRNAYVRASVWAKMKSELENLMSLRATN